MIPHLRAIAQWEAQQLRAGHTDASEIAAAEIHAAWLLYEAHGHLPTVALPRRWDLSWLRDGEGLPDAGQRNGRRKKAVA